MDHYRQPLDEHIKLALELLILLTELLRGCERVVSVCVCICETKGHGAHTIIILVNLLSVCKRLSVLVLRDVFGLAILDSLTLALVGGGRLVAVLSHDGCVSRLRGTLETESAQVDLTSVAGEKGGKRGWEGDRMD